MTSTYWSKKIHALFTQKLTLLIVAGSLAACAPLAPESPPIEATRRAQELVDSGTLLMREKRFAEARASFTLARELAPSPAAIDGLGCIAFLEGDLGAAEKLFVKANQMDPNYSNALANLALVYEIDGRTDVAKQLYLRALAADPENFRARNNFAGLVAAREGSRRAVDNARKELLKAKLVADHPTIQANLERLGE